MGRVPKIAGGAGALVEFHLTIPRNVKGVDGKTHHPVEARCTDAKLQTRVGVVLANGMNLESAATSSCTPKG